jgi:hypothetical protein
MSKCRLDDFPRMDGGAVDSPSKEILDGNEPCAHIQMKNAEHLVIKGPKTEPQKLPSLRRRAQHG